MLINVTSYHHEKMSKLRNREYCVTYMLDVALWCLRDHIFKYGILFISL